MPTQQLNHITAWINAGGRGTRLHNIIDPHARYGVAKALLKVGGKQRVRLIDHQISWLKKHGVHRIIVSCGDQIEVAHYIAHAYSHDPSITPLTTSRRFGTAGDLLHALQSHPELFSKLLLVINADTIVDLDVPAFIESHGSNNDITIALTQIAGLKNHHLYGLNRHSRVIYCGELHNTYPRGSKTDPDIIVRATSMGALVVSKRFLNDANWTLPVGEFSIYTDVIGESFKRRTMGGFDAGHAYTIDIGTAPTYAISQLSERNPLDPYICT